MTSHELYEVSNRGQLNCLSKQIPQAFNNWNTNTPHRWPSVRKPSVASGYPHQGPGPCITNVFATRRKNSSQWYRSFQRKLRSHWLKFLRHVAITLVIQGPVMQKAFPCHDVMLNCDILDLCWNSSHGVYCGRVCSLRLGGVSLHLPSASNEITCYPMLWVEPEIFPLMQFALCKDSTSLVKAISSDF